MGRANNILNEARKQELTQYHNLGNKLRCMGDIEPIPTEEALEAGVYQIKSDMRGIYFEKHDHINDEILRFDDPRMHEVKEECTSFFDKRVTDRFKKFKFCQSYGVLMEGPPGTGKTIMLKIIQEDLVEKNNVVFLADDAYLLSAGLKQFREVEKDRKAIAVVEELDVVCRYGERAMSELMDGESKVEGVLYLATTNHIERINPKILREGRFDRKVHIGMPPASGRYAYFKLKLGMDEDKEKITELSEKTDGFSFAQMKAFLVSVYCFEHSIDDTIARLRRGIKPEDRTENSNSLTEAIDNSLITEVDEIKLDEAIEKYYNKKLSKAAQVLRNL